MHLIYLSVYYILSSSVFRALLVLSLLSQLFFFLLQHSTPDFLEILYSTSYLSGMKDNDIKIVFCPITDISRQILELSLLSNSWLPLPPKLSSLRNCFPLIPSQQNPIYSLLSWKWYSPLFFILHLRLLFLEIFFFCNIILHFPKVSEYKNLGQATFFWNFRGEPSHS